MATVVVLTGLAFAAVVVLFTLAAAAILFKTLLRVVLLPLLLLKWMVMGTVMLIVGPILFVVGALAMLLAGFAVMLPLAPLLLCGAILWCLLRSTRRPAVA